MPAARRRGPAVLLAAAALGGTAAACGSAGDGATEPTVPPATPATAPSGGPQPAGVITVPPVTAAAVDPGTGTLALAVEGPDRLLLTELADPARSPREVPLPGPAAGVALAGDGGPLLVAVGPALLEVDPVAAAVVGSTDLPGIAQGVSAVAGRAVVPLGDRIVLAGGGDAPVEVPGYVDAAAVAPLGAAIGVVDRRRSAVSELSATGDPGPALRAGEGAAAAVADRFGRMLVTDARGEELLVFSGDPLLLRQRVPLAGTPFALAADPGRDLVWVALTARDELVGLDVAGGEPVERSRVPTVHRPQAVAVDPASGRVFVGSADGGLHVVDAEVGR